jgi:hypothetical protein
MIYLKFLYSKGDMILDGNLTDTTNVHRESMAHPTGGSRGERTPYTHLVFGTTCNNSSFLAEWLEKLN